MIELSRKLTGLWSLSYSRTGWWAADKQINPFRAEVEVVLVATNQVKRQSVAALDRKSGVERTLAAGHSCPN